MRILRENINQFEALLGDTYIYYESDKVQDVKVVADHLIGVFEKDRDLLPAEMKMMFEKQIITAGKADLKTPDKVFVHFRVPKGITCRMSFEEVVVQEGVLTEIQDIGCGVCVIDESKSHIINAIDMGDFKSEDKILILSTGIYTMYFKLGV